MIFWYYWYFDIFEHINDFSNPVQNVHLLPTNKPAVRCWSLSQRYQRISAARQTRLQYVFQLDNTRISYGCRHYLTQSWLPVPKNINHLSTSLFSIISEFVLGFLVARSGLCIVVVIMFYLRDIYCIMLYCFSLSYSFCLLYKAIQSSDCNDVK